MNYLIISYNLFKQRVAEYKRILPSANELYGKVMFYACLSFCSQGEEGV